MATQEELELNKELGERLALVKSDPSYVGAEPTAGDQWMLAFVGLIVPAVLMIGGWLLYG
jgi:hypothetical protein